MTKHNIMHQKPSVAFIGTYPPRECGIATFTQDLLHACQQMLGNHISCLVAAMNYSSTDTQEYPSEVIWEIDQDKKSDYRQLAYEINTNPLIAGVFLQHEYGIYGGEDGENILSFLRNCKKPVIVTLHTVLPEPLEKMRQVTKEIIERASILVVLTQSSKNLLQKLYPKSISKVFVIPHGIHPTLFELPKKHKKDLKLDKWTILSTFGLLSRGKGIEYVIKALPKVVREHPQVRYLVLGQTHPVVARQEGESYRIELMDLVKKLRLTDNVKFYDQYLTLDDLLKYLKATDIYIATSLNPNQAVSGTFSYAMGTGRAVISTEFAQARELITPATGELVPIADTKAYSGALLNLLESKDKLKKAYSKAFLKTRSMLWNNVAHDYLKILTTQSKYLSHSFPFYPPIKLTHLRTMTDRIGLFQFAKYTRPLLEYGYTLDDNARALIVCNWLLRSNNELIVKKLLARYLRFISLCQKEDGTFTNYLDHNASDTHQNTKEDLEDCFARALWALAETASNPHLSAHMRNKALRMWTKAYPHIKKFTHLRARAFAIKALIKMGQTNEVRAHADKLVKAFEKNSHAGWRWFEPHLSYNNAVLPESLLWAADTLKERKYMTVAKKALRFLIRKTFIGDIYVPIGQSGWYRRKGRRSYFDQQPEDPSSMILALESAYTVTQNMAYAHLASKCFTWFLGNNLLGLPLYDQHTGGCCDGLGAGYVNQNQGAESTVSYLLARVAIQHSTYYESRANKRSFPRDASGSLQRSSLAKI